MKKESFEILLKEYENLFQDWKRIREEGSNRMKLLLSVTVFVLSGLGLLFQFRNNNSQINAMFFIAGFGLLMIVSIQTLQFMINRNISSDLYLRAMSRIRRCFIDNDNDLSKYFTWQGNDSPTSFLDFSNLGLIDQSLVFLSIFISCFLSAITNLCFQDLFKSILFFLFVLPVTYFILYISIKKKFKRAREKAKDEIRFDLIQEDV